MHGQRRTSTFDLVALTALAACFCGLVDALIPQIQLTFLGGNVLVTNVLSKLVLLGCVVLSYVLRPRVRTARLPLSIWLICVGFVVLETPYLLVTTGLPLPDVLQSFNSYYLFLLIGPAALALRGAVPERRATRYTVGLFCICAGIGIAQHLTGQPLVRTESNDGSFTIVGWQFYDSVRAFALSSSGLNFGMFCCLGGALGVALSRQHRTRGILLAVLSAIACYATITRLCFLTFVCACTYSAVLTFGTKRSRGLWLPLAYFALGIATILMGVRSLDGDQENQIQSTSSLLERLIEWTFYWEMLKKSSLTQILFGLGLVQHEKIEQSVPVVIDNVPIALVLHIGVVGLTLFSILMTKMWLFLRREAITNRSPFIIAAASVWATFLCAGTFNVIFSLFGSIFALAILCQPLEGQLDSAST